jgi:hypothetical protein
MGKMRLPPILPNAYRTVGDMIREEVSIIASCRKCGNAFDVDLRVTAVLYGIDASLIGKHPKCKLFDCDGECVFLVSFGEGSPRVTLDRFVDSS